MIPVVTSYNSYTQAREHFVKVLEQVGQGDSIVIIQRRGHSDVAMIAADELSTLLEEVYLLRSPANAKRLFQALDWSQEELSQTPQSSSLEQLRHELETELDQEKASEA